MSSTLTDPRLPQVTDSQSGARPPSAARAALRLGETRWALAATGLFAVGGLAELVGAPTWLWWTLYLACYLTGGWGPGLAGVQALRDRTLDVDLLMIVAAVLAASIGQVLDGGLLIVIFATSGALEAIATQRTQASVQALLTLAPEQATQLIAERDVEKVVPTSDLVAGDVLLIRPGERVGADGRVIDGASDVDQASITGEPLPVFKQAGDEVFAGTLNGTGMLRVRVTKAAEESVLARIVALVEEASATKAKTQLFIEKVEQRYSVAMVTVTLALFLIPLAAGGAFRPTLLRAMTFMIVASPCAVVLATMPPLLAAIANAGRHGVLVKSAVVMEQLGGITRVVFDKTGTLTEGTPRVARIDILGDGGHPPDLILALAAAAENPSEHPIARAVVAAATERGLKISPVRDFTSTPGRGVTAGVNDHFVAVGSPALLTGDGNSPVGQKEAAHAVALVQGHGATAVVVFIDEVAVAVLTVVDRVRPRAAAAVSTLARLTGHNPVLLTGDNLLAARQLADEVGITDVTAGLLPADKAARVRELQTAGARVLLVGDGVNDAPALAAADIGVAMGRSGSDLALETADAVVVRDDLATVPSVMALSRRARRVVVANLVIASTIITALVAWDLLGHLPLPLGVAGHEGSTVIVGLNGLRLLRTRAWRHRT